MLETRKEIETTKFLVSLNTIDLQDREILLKKNLRDLLKKNVHHLKIFFENFIKKVYYENNKRDILLRYFISHLYFIRVHRCT